MRFRVFLSHVLGTRRATLTAVVCRLIVLTIRYGDRMRAWVDVGYSTVRDN